MGHFPEITVTRQGRQPARNYLTKAQIVKRLDTSLHLVEKLIDAGYLMANETTDDDLAHFEQAATISAAGDLAVIQAAPVVPETKPWRPYFGTSSYLSDADYADALRGDWNAKGLDIHAILTTGYLAVGCGGFIVGLLRVEPELDPASNSELTRFKAKTLAHLTRSQTISGGSQLGTDYLASAAEPELQFAYRVIGKRFEPRRGGSIIFI